MSHRVLYGRALGIDALDYHTLIGDRSFEYKCAPRNLVSRIHKILALISCEVIMEVSQSLRQMKDSG